MASLTRLAPEKNAGGIRRSMAKLRTQIDDADDVARDQRKPRTFAPAGQSTQMIVGADDSSDRAIIATSASLYGSYRLSRVYYSAFSPIPQGAASLPLKPPPLVREHRLYQADWLMRFYGFDAGEIPTSGTGMLALDIDPKLAWALANRAQFPLDLHTAPREMLLRVPGLGVKAVQRIVAARRVRRLTVDDLRRLRVPLRRVLPFLKIQGAVGTPTLDSLRLAQAIQPPSVQQLDLFVESTSGEPANDRSAVAAPAANDR